MSRSRWFLLLGLLIALALAGAAYWLTFGAVGDPEVAAPSAPAVSDAARATVDAAEATAQEGFTEVEMSLKVRMPPDFDDGVPRRKIAGDGLAEFNDNLASIDYGMDEVPNSAGFFGHVDGDMSVVYEGSRFILTFPIMADVLEGNLDWMSYQLSDFSHPRILGAGIGQLREIGLADPRIGFALASSGVGGEPDAEGRLPIDLAQAQGAVDPELQPALQELQELGVQQVLLETEVDEDGFLRAYSYDLAYPPAGSGREAKLSVTVDIGETGVDDAVDVPPDSAIQSYLDYADVSPSPGG